MWQDPDPLANFEEKVTRHSKNNLMDRTVSDFKSNLEDQWTRLGYWWDMR
jgi:hypothetical protein